LEEPIPDPETLGIPELQEPVPDPESLGTPRNSVQFPAIPELQEPIADPEFLTGIASRPYPHIGYCD